MRVTVWIWLCRLAAVAMLLALGGEFFDDHVPAPLARAGFYFLLALLPVAAVLGLIYELRGLRVPCPACRHPAPIERYAGPRMRVLIECGRCGDCHEIHVWWTWRGYRKV